MVDDLANLLDKAPKMIADVGVAARQGPRMIDDIASLLDKVPTMIYNLANLFGKAPKMIVDTWIMLNKVPEMIVDTVSLLDKGSQIDQRFSEPARQGFQEETGNAHSGTSVCPQRKRADKWPGKVSGAEAAPVRPGVDQAAERPKGRAAYGSSVSPHSLPFSRVTGRGG